MEIEEAQRRYREDGCFVAADAVEPGMLDRLEAAARSVWTQVRSGAVDVAGKGGDGGSIFGLLAPEFGEPAFAEYLCSDPVRRYVESFLGPELRLGHVHLWCSDATYDTGWHRDHGAARDVSEAEEMEILNAPKGSIKWQLALVDDPCLWVVPASHLRYRTEQEHQALNVDRRMAIDGQQQVVLKRGQTLFWNGSLVHRGVKPAGLDERLTLTGGLRQYDPAAGPEELDERFRWRLDANIRATLPPRMQLWYDRWRMLQKG